ncbi:MAG: N-acetyltransferase [Chloroflexota bacterium]|nr:N-acetyltransferase [Chloroflexota bacterium]
MAVLQQLCTTIRDEHQSDVLAIHNVHERAFGGDYEPRLVEMLRNAGHVTSSLVAVVEDQVVGHVLFSPVTFDPALAEHGWVALGPIGVLPEYQGRGIGSRLVRQGLDRCRSAGWDGAVLLGSPGYYSRFGFVEASHHGLSSEFGDGAAFQAAELRQGALEEIEGKVLYAPEFRET